METLPNLFDLLTWADAREVNTRNGPMLLKKAPIEDIFWPLWERHQRHYKMMGFSVSKDLRTQEPVLCHWSPVDQSELDHRADNIAASRAVRSDFNAPCPPGLAYLPFQVAGIEFACNGLGIVLAEPHEYNPDYAKGNIPANETINQSPACGTPSGKNPSSQSKSEKVAETERDRGMARESEPCYPSCHAPTGGKIPPPGGTKSEPREVFRREWTETSSESVGIVPKTLPFGVHNGIPCKDAGAQHAGEASNILQSGLRSSYKTNSCGSGRTGPFHNETKVPGQKENNRAESSRVDSCESKALTEKGGTLNPSGSGILIADQMG